jgi:Ca2+-binding EF-hand superfamily protein
LESQGSRYDRYTITSISPRRNVDDYKTITTGLDGLTDVFNEINDRTEKRSMSRSKSYAQPSCTSLNKKQRQLLYPIIKWFMEQVKICREIEHFKIELWHTADFNLADMYKMFSVNKQITLAKHEFVKGWQIFGIITRNKEKLEHIFKRYTDSKMSFRQFWLAFSPFDLHHNRDLINRQPLYGKSFPKDKSRVFKQNTNQKIVQLIARLVKAELQLRALQKHANAAIDDPQRCFQFLSRQSDLLDLSPKKSILKNKCQKHHMSFSTYKQDSISCTWKDKEEPVDSGHYIDQGSLLKRMTQFGMEVDLNDIGMLIKLYDRTGNNRISYEDFIFQLLGID